VRVHHERLSGRRELAEIYQLTPRDLETLAGNPAVGDAIRRERATRVRSGQAAREMAAQHFTQAPGVLNALMSSESVHPKHRVEAVRELRATAFAEDARQTAASSAEKFLITINLGHGHVEHYEKELRPVKELPPTIENEPGNDWGWRER
jgi:hypothetical protein